jgi:hypothetical protein
MRRVVVTDSSDSNSRVSRNRGTYRGVLPVGDLLHLAKAMRSRSSPSDICYLLAFDGGHSAGPEFMRRISGLGDRQLPVDQPATGRGIGFADPAPVGGSCVPESPRTRARRPIQCIISASCLIAVPFKTIIFQPVPSQDSPADPPSLAPELDSTAALFADCSTPRMETPRWIRAFAPESDAKRPSGTVSFHGTISSADCQSETGRPIMGLPFRNPPSGPKR